jgi:hypothetical protein
MLPLRRATGYPLAFSTRTTTTVGFWAQILEKAVAKATKDYNAINYLRPCTTLRLLTGKPVNKFSTYRLNAATFAATVKSGLENGAVVVNAKYRVKYGLEGRQYYAVVGQVTINGTPLVRLYNPRGSDNYNGQWSNTDTARWTAAAKRSVSSYHNFQKNGYFFMPASLMAGRYGQFYTIYTNEASLPYKRNSLATTWDRKSASAAKQLTFTINNPKTQRVAVSLTGVSYYSLHNWGRCSDSAFKIDNVLWRLLDKNGKAQTTVDNVYYRWLSPSDGGNDMVFANLPAG